ncbi:hypothetical protein BD410DRAFT_803439 [Rickenella mellea]|uniref:Uncharacterized protein n=1 Tax=Rickenella mellea TaxID=50990 RepID=A0A4Y7Q763_9AGAM|nr:hypothetical protein BD410DRAFT_803439 [Rickenella mellea]
MSHHVVSHHIASRDLWYHLVALCRYVFGRYGSASVHQTQLSPNPDSHSSTLSNPLSDPQISSVILSAKTPNYIWNTHFEDETIVCSSAEHESGKPGDLTGIDPWETRGYGSQRVFFLVVEVEEVVTALRERRTSTFACPYVEMEMGWPRLSMHVELARKRAGAFARLCMEMMDDVVVVVVVAVWWLLRLSMHVELVRLRAVCDDGGECAVGGHGVLVAAAVRACRTVQGDGGGGGRSSPSTLNRTIGVPMRGGGGGGGAGGGVGGQLRVLGDGVRGPWLSWMFDGVSIWHVHTTRQGGGYQVVEVEEVVTALRERRTSTFACPYVEMEMGWPRLSMHVELARKRAGAFARLCMEMMDDVVVVVVVAVWWLLRLSMHVELVRLRAVCDDGGECAVGGHGVLVAAAVRACRTVQGDGGGGGRSSPSTLNRTIGVPMRGGGGGGGAGGGVGGQLRVLGDGVRGPWLSWMFDGVSIWHVHTTRQGGGYQMIWMLKINFCNFSNDAEEFDAWSIAPQGTNSENKQRTQADSDHNHRRRELARQGKTRHRINATITKFTTAMSSVTQVTHHSFNPLVPRQELKNEEVAVSSTISTLHVVHLLQQPQLWYDNLFKKQGWPTTPSPSSALSTKTHYAGSHRHSKCLVRPVAWRSRSDSNSAVLFFKEIDDYGLDNQTDPINNRIATPTIRTVQDLLTWWTSMLANNNSPAAMALDILLRQCRHTLTSKSLHATSCWADIEGVMPQVEIIRTFQGQEFALCEGSTDIKQLHAVHIVEDAHVEAQRYKITCNAQHKTNILDVIKFSALQRYLDEAAEKEAKALKAAHAEIYCSDPIEDYDEVPALSSIYDDMYEEISGYSTE